LERGEKGGGKDSDVGDYPFSENRKPGTALFQGSAVGKGLRG